MKQIRRLPPRKLDLFAASPVSDKCEFRAAFERACALYPSTKLGYIGTDGTHHYFQERGVAEAYLVPVSAGWSKR
jgi:hypothetical protein